MRAVLDTNVVVSAILSPAGAPAEVMRRWQSGAFEALVSEEICQEYRAAFEYPKIRARYRVTEAEALGLLDGLEQTATMVVPEGILGPIVEPDPADDKFVECAVAGSADYIVSGDAHLLLLGQYRGIRIVTPAVFLLLLGRE